MTFHPPGTSTGDTSASLVCEPDKHESTYDVRSTPYLERPEDIRRLYLALPEPHNVIFILGALTGARVGELLGMDWRDIDFAGRKVHVRQQMQDGKL